MQCGSCLFDISLTRVEKRVFFKKVQPGEFYFILVLGGVKPRFL